MVAYGMGDDRSPGYFIPLEFFLARVYAVPFPDIKSLESCKEKGSQNVTTNRRKSGPLGRGQVGQDVHDDNEVCTWAEDDNAVAKVNRGSFLKPRCGFISHS
jgi:hypothetical protein